MAPSPTIRRLLRETAELSPSAANPSPAFHAAPVSDADLHEWHFTLLGPPSPSPYAGGLYHGRITLPPQYPLKPPNFRFLTPSGRFEVNREICLSISGFHEETWMPAWGVRTALTALRTFMAEPGTAGQVGGLEAPEAVRKRFAKESREWRCSGCERTNEEVMRDWWAACRAQGVKVDEEGADVGLDSLPEGMAVEARSVGEKTDPKTEVQTQPATLLSTAPQPAAMPQQQPSRTHTQNQSQTSIPLPPTQATEPAQPKQQPPPPLGPPPPQQRSHLLSPTPTPEAAQLAAESHLTPTDTLPNTSTQRPMLNLHRPPLAAASAALAEHAALQTTQQHQQQNAERRDRREGGTVTIDRAIGAVFLMLVVMIVRKVFYGGGGGGGGWVVGSDADGGTGWGNGGGGGLRMEREL